ncbi:hypothetical protein [Lactiplantibacillus mudanjiangensis]|uniref:Uncharacterized protein n=1 Tax=Lactiplantibacillus mudanjiangensis TaxID=1296538 RepID=A0A660DZP6_9LACO|nr:hypothetical protein [Lactiplantibacillus mudanjiangensis]VDG25827.1 hypothetical protein MUDAN_IGPPGNFN_01272 [Lactiplantibacillus mudanjiangensis]VDG28892.1 hypothetical protein MUDAN_MDHGFNIF_03293 [Lactiplantibacillus mudanjiangensis]
MITIALDFENGTCSMKTDGAPASSVVAALISLGTQTAIENQSGESKDTIAGIKAIVDAAAERKEAQK